MTDNVFVKQVIRGLLNRSAKTFSDFPLHHKGLVTKLIRSKLLTSYLSTQHWDTQEFKACFSSRDRFPTLYAIIRRAPRIGQLHLAQPSIRLCREPFLATDIGIMQMICHSQVFRLLSADSSAEKSRLEFQLGAPPTFRQMTMPRKAVLPFRP